LILQSVNNSRYFCSHSSMTRMKVTNSSLLVPFSISLVQPELLSPLDKVTLELLLFSLTAKFVLNVQKKYNYNNYKIWNKKNSIGVSSLQLHVYRFAYKSQLFTLLHMFYIDRSKFLHWIEEILDRLSISDRTEDRLLC